VNVDTLSNVAEAMRAMLTVKADELAKSSGLVKRSRKVTGSRLARTLVFGWLQNAPPSADGLARAGFGHGLKISAQGLDKRLATALLDRFEAVHVLDSTQLLLPAALAAQWPGTGGSGPVAALKVDVALELKSGRLSLGLRAGRQADPQPAGGGARAGGAAPARPGLLLAGPAARTGAARGIRGQPPAAGHRRLPGGRGAHRLAALARRAGAGGGGEA
jgi:hypothetical protein